MRGGLGVEEYYVPDVPWVLFWKPERYFGNDPSLTGSHGCVGLIPEQAKLLYEWVTVGTKIVITWERLRK